MKYIFRKMQESDLEFYLSVRNECSEFLHDNSKYVINDSIIWFNKTNPEFYIINYNGADIGYFRTSKLELESIYIGCDIHKDWRGKKLAYEAYIEFMDYIFEKYDLFKINLEVLSTNDVAYNLYKKIGFVVIDNRFQKIFRNNQIIDSILMSITKEEFKEKYR